MSRAAPDPAPNGLYESDFHAWTQEQARLIEAGRWDRVDVPNLADEVRSLGHEVKGEIEDRMEILLSYLLKWQVLAEYRGLAWRENISRQRRELRDLAADNPSLAPFVRDSVVEAYENARRRLKYETYFYPVDFPASCPFTIDQVFDSDYFPEEWDAPSIGAFPTARTIA